MKVKARRLASHFLVPDCKIAEVDHLPISAETGNLAIDGMGTDPWLIQWLHVLYFTHEITVKIGLGVTTIEIK